MFTVKRAPPPIVPHASEQRPLTVESNRIAIIMAATPVSLQEVLSAIGGPLEEQSLWALLYQTSKSLAKALQGGERPELLITPETTLLFHGGDVKFLQGIAAPESSYTAPELVLGDGDWQGTEDREKSYIYSLGTTLFTAMHFELENGKEPKVSSQLNWILLKMVEDSLETRASFDELQEACGQQRLDNGSVKEEVNKLVTYVMGTAPELSSSEYGDTDMDDANLESEFQQAMRIQPTGSVEQLYSPSYGSRASSSLSLNSSGNRSDLIANFHSSLPMVYCSSQERLGAKSSGRRVPRPKWSSHDRLLSPLMSIDVETLASKGKRQSPLEAAGHRHYHSHLYTPKRTRKTEARQPPAVAVNVERSASFNSTGFYRSSSDGVSKKSSGVIVQQPPVAMTTLNLDDMPALPPQTTKEAIPTSPDVSQDLSTSLTLEEDGSATPPPPIPYCEPPLFTPPVQEEVGSSSDTVTTDATFDYNDLTPPIQNGKGTGSHGDDEFDFSLSESPPPPPPPPPVSTLPLEEQTPPTSPEAPPTPLTSPPHEETPPTSVSVATSDSAGKEDEMLNERSENDGTTESKSQIQRHLTPRTALVKAFEDFDKIGETKLPDEDELGSGEGDAEGQNERDEEGREKKSEGGNTEGEDLTSSAVDLDELYAKVDMSKKRRKKETSEKQDDDMSEGEVEIETTFKPELVRKAASVEDIVGPDYAEVHHPKRSSMPLASSPAHSPTHSEPGYARIEMIVSPPPGTGAAASAEPHPPLIEPHPPLDQGKLYEVTATDTIGRRNQRSITKLGVMFGPEFKNLSGLQTQNKPQSVKSRSESSKVAVKVVPEGRRIVKVILLNGRQVPFVVERNSLCAELFQQVLSHQSLQEKRFFGLAISKEWDEIFLEMDSKLSKYAPPGWANTPVPAPGSKGQRPKAFNIFFRVKFYVENINDLKFAQTRHLYYLQLRKDLLEGKTYCHEQPSLKMASFALQAEKGDIPSKKQPYFRMEDYVPLKVMDKVGKKTIEELLPNMHAELRLMSREEAELEFLKEAQKLPEYGMVFYRVAQNKSDPIGSVWLGFCVRGIVVYDYHKDIKTPLHYCSWKKTQNLSFSNRKFIIELQDSKPLHFYTNSYKKARYLLHLSISYHTFQLTSRGHLPQETEYAGVSAESTTLSEQETSFQRSPESATRTWMGDMSHDQKSHDYNSLELTVRLLKDNLHGLGINIVDLSESSGGSSRIVIESIVKGGPADSNGVLKRGDIVESVNGQSLTGLTRQEASAIIKNSADVVDLQILRDERTAIPFQEPSLQELTSAVIEEPSEVAIPPQTTQLEEDFSTLPEGETVVVHVKRESGTFGLRIAGGKGKPFGGGFIYVKTLVKGSPAERCGRLKERDIIMKINGRALLDITHRAVATLIVTAKSDNVELLVHRPSSAKWLETSHEVYMAEQKGRGMTRKREPSWSDLEPWMEQHLVTSMPTIEERGGDVALEDQATEDGPWKDGDDRPPEIPPELPPDDPPSNVEECPPSLPEEEPPSMMEDDSQQLPQDGENVLPHSNLSEDEQSNERTHDESTHSRLLHKEESFQGEPPLPPEGEPPLLTFDESNEELSWELAEQDRSTEQLHSPHSTAQQTMHISDGEPIISESPQLQEATDTSSISSSSEAEGRDLSAGLPPANGLLTVATTEPHSEHDDRSDEADSLQLHSSLEQDNVFTISLKKGFRGLGFMLDKQRSLAEGAIFIGQIESDPAKSDGRLKQGDQILEVDDESLEGLSYRNALLLLRQTEGIVELVIMRREKKKVASIIPAPPDSPALPQSDDSGSTAGETDHVPPLPLTPLPNEDI